MLSNTSLLSVVGYSVLMVVSATGNITVLTLLVRRKKAGKASRLDTLLIHLAIADLVVTFLSMATNIGWTVSAAWRVGFMCHASVYAWVFGIYLSSFMVVCITVDRYFAVLKPLNVSWDARLRYVLGGIWGAAALASVPISIIYHTAPDPNFKDEVQCVMSAELSELQLYAYMTFSLSLLYILPLVTTVYCSCAVIREIIKRSNPANDAMRRSGVGVLRRARARTLKMSITIVAVFIICWTPYYSVCIWNNIDKNSLNKVNPMVIRILWLFTYTNSCANPIVYGIFNIRRKNNAATSQQCILAISEGSRQPADRGSEAV